MIRKQWVLTDHTLIFVVTILYTPVSLSRTSSRVELSRMRQAELTGPELNSASQM